MWTRDVDVFTFGRGIARRRSTSGTACAADGSGLQSRTTAGLGPGASDGDGGGRSVAAWGLPPTTPTRSASPGLSLSTCLLRAGRIAGDVLGVTACPRGGIVAGQGKRAELPALALVMCSALASPVGRDVDRLPSPPRRSSCGTQRAEG